MALFNFFICFLSKLPHKGYLVYFHVNKKHSGGPGLLQSSTTKFFSEFLCISFKYCEKNSSFFGGKGPFDGAVGSTWCGTRVRSFL